MPTLGDLADELLSVAERAQARVEAVFEPTVRLGVTGLSQAGKTVFITSLVANLLRRGRMGALNAEAEGRIRGAILTPQPDMEAPRFDYERHLADIYGSDPQWPESTRSVSQLRVSFRVERRGLLAGLTGDAVVHLDIVDYPGEWLLDLGLMPQSYAEWSVSALASARQRPEAATFLAWVDAQNASEPFDETVAIEGAQIFAAYLKAAKAAGRSGVAPGRFLLPGEMEGAPALTFMPLPSEAAGPLAAECARRFEAYKRVVVRPFFRDHFGRLDRQIVLVDLLSAVGQGPESLRDLQETLTGILGAFRPGASSWLAPLLGRRVDKLLLAVTKADHIHHESHPALNALVRDLLARTIDRAAFRGAEVDAMALAGVRATVEDTVREGGEALPAVRGRLLDTGREAVLFPGEPPETLAALKQGGWDTTAFDAHAFAPPRLEKREDEGPPHVRLDRAAEFLFGDKLA